MKSKKNKRRRRLLAMLLCLCMVFPKFGNNVVHAEPDGGQPGVESETGGEFQESEAIKKEADASTFDDYKNILGEEKDGGRYAGRVWADKSVYTADQTVNVKSADGKIIGSETIKNDSDFLIRFSALGSSRVVQESAPVDIVLVLDISGSMGSPILPENGKIPDPAGAEKWPFKTDDDCSRLRMAKLVPAVNTMMDSLMKNDKNRISIVLYDSSAYVLLPLAHYTKFGNEDFISATQHHWQSWSWPNKENEKVNDRGESVGGQWACTITATYQEANEKREKQVTSWSNTNIMAGISAGMDQLQPTNDGVNRIPVMVLLTDGDANTITHPVDDADLKGVSIKWNQIPNAKSINVYGNDNPFTFNSKDSIFNGYYKDGSWKEANLFPNAVSNDIQVYAGGDDHLFLTDAETYKNDVGLATLMHAAYMKDQVKKRYLGTSPMVYTIGYDREDSSYSNIVLNPRDCLDSDSLGIGAAWKNWLNNNNAGLSFKFESASDIDKKVIEENIKYNDKYFAGSSGNDVSGSIQEVFDAIYTEVTGLAFNPVRVGTGADTTFSYTDPIGEYMEVKDVKALSLFGKIYSNPTKTDRTDGSTIYTFSSGTEIIRNPGYIREPVVDIGTIEIVVSKDNKDSQILTANIPAYALPIHCETVTMEKGTANVESYKTNAEEVEPFQLWYTVGLIDDIKNNDGTIDVQKISEEYRKANTDDSDHIYFFSNLYDKTHKAEGQDEDKAYGNALVKFDPSKENRYYYFQKNRVIYKNGKEGVLNSEGRVEGAVLAGDSIEDGERYYLVIDFYRPLNDESGKGEEVKYVVSRTGAELKPAIEKIASIRENDIEYSNVFVTKKGGIRLGRLNQFTKTKQSNLTFTSTQYYAPTYGSGHADLDGTAETITIHLGNNGRLAVKTKPDLEVEKLQAVNDDGATVDKGATKEPLTVKEEDTVTYFIRVSNKGSKTATGVTVEDDVPKGLNLVEGSAGDKALVTKGDDGNQHISWSVGELEPGKSVTVSFKVTVPEVKGATSWLNIAAAKSEDTPDEPSNEVEIKTALLTIEKEQSLNDGNRTKDLLLVRKGDKVTYYLTVTNISEEMTYDVVVRDEIPENLIFESTDNNGLKLEGSREITWNLGDIPGKGTPNDNTRQVSFTVTVPEDGVYWLNQGKAEYSPKDPTETNPDNPDEPQQPPRESIESNKVEIEKIILKKAQKRDGDSDFTDKKLIVKAGETVTYQLTLTNQGQVDIQKPLTITDEIPEGLTLVSGSLTKGEVKSDGRTVTWTLEPDENGTVLAAGESKTMEFQVKVPEAVDNITEAWKNIGFVTDPDHPDEPDKSNEVETEPAKVVIEKEQSLDGENFTKDLLIVREEDEVTYRLTVKNESKATAYNVVVTDRIPVADGISVTLDEKSISPKENVTVEDGVIKWEFDTLAGGTQKELCFTVTVPEQGSYWKNQGTVTYYPEDPSNNPENPPKEEKEETEEVAIEKIVLKKAQKRAGDSDFTDKKLTVKAGEVVTYQLTLTNLGEADIKKALVIIDEIPEGLTLVEDTITADGTESDGKITWTLEADQTGVVLAAGKSRTVEFQVQIPEDTDENPGPWKNVGLVTDPDHPDKPEESNEVETESAKIVIEKEQSLDGEHFTKDLLIVKAGDEVTYRLRVENVSETTAYDVIVTDKIPVTGDAGVLLKEGSIVPENTGAEKDGVITWDLGDMGGNSTRILSFTVIVPKEGGYWKNQGTVRYSPEDPEKPEDPDHPRGEEEVESEEVEIEKISIEKTQAVNRGNATKGTLNVEEGDRVTYYLTVTNHGEKDAENITVTDKVPRGLILESVSGEGKADDSGRIVWTLNRVPGGGNYVVSFEVTVPEGEDSRTWTNIGFVTDKGPEDPDPTPSNEVIIKETQISIVKAQSPDDGEHWYTSRLKVEEGDEITYRLTVTNSGETTAYDVIVTDKIPTDDAGNDLMLVEGSVRGGESSAVENGQITWKLGDLGQGEERELFFKIQVPEKGTYWENMGFVTYLPPDPENPDEPSPENPVEIPSNEVEIEKTENDEPKLSVRKTQYVGEDESKETEGLLSVKPGDVITYGITVTNDTDVDADHVVVTDSIPEGLIFVEDSAKPNGTAGEDGIITWKIGTLEAHSSMKVRFQAEVPEVKETTKWTNIAYVASGNPEPDPDDPKTPSNEVEAVPGIRIEKTQKLTKDEDSKPTTDLLHVKKEDQVTYYLTVTNTGDATAFDVVVKDTVPTDNAGNKLALVEDSVKGGEENSYDESRREITWRLGAIEAGGKRTVEFTVTVPAEGTRWINGASVRYTLPDPDDPEKPGPERTPDIPSNEVEIEKEDPEIPEPEKPENAISIEKEQQVNGRGEPTKEILHVQKGDEVTYYLTVTNTSDTKAVDVIVKDTIPEDTDGNQLELVEDSVEGGLSHEINGGTITWNLGDIAGGDSQTVKFTVIVPESEGHWRNMASTSYIPEKPETPENPDNPDNPEEPAPEPERTPDIPSNEVEIQAGTATIQLKARKVLNGADLTNGQFTFRIQGISAEITEETEDDTRKTEAAEGAGKTENGTDTGTDATPSNAERNEAETSGSDDRGGLSAGSGKTISRKLMTQARMLTMGEGMSTREYTVPMPSSSTAANNADGEIVFGEIQFSQAGTYTYKISEVREARRGYTFDTTEYTVEVVVSRDQATGKLSAQVNIVKPEGADEILFTNRYRRPSSGGGKPSGGGSDPQPGPGTDPTPENPDNPNPDTPNPDNPTDTPNPENPPLPTELPDPNDPNSPDTVTIEENGVPRTYMKVWDPVNEEFMYIPEEDVPLFGLLPKTGEEDRRRWLGIILALSLMGIGTLTVEEWRRRKKGQETG